MGGKRKILKTCKKKYNVKKVEFFFKPKEKGGEKNIEKKNKSKPKTARDDFMRGLQNFNINVCERNLPQIITHNSLKRFLRHGYVAM